jgi:alkaline phosphatase D
MKKILTARIYFVVLVLCTEAFFGNSIYGQNKKNTSANKSLLQAGPMVGYSEMKEVMLWVQTTKEAEVYINYIEVRKEKDSLGKNIYFPKNVPIAKNDIFSTKKVKTTAENAFIAKLVADKLEPGEK